MSEAVVERKIRARPPMLWTNLHADGRPPDNGRNDLSHSDWN